MKIHTVSGINPYIKGNTKFPKNPNGSNVNVKSNINGQNKIKNSHKPSFGLDPLTLALYGGYAIFYAAAVGGACYQTKVQEEKRAAEERKIKEEEDAIINSISERIGIQPEEAKEYHYKFIKSAQIPVKGDGQEEGLNAVMGYDYEKYKLEMNVVAPLVNKQKDGFYTFDNIPNGVLLYGPPGGGKTYLNKQLCEHLNHFGVETIDVSLDEINHDKNVETIKSAFDEGKKRFDETGKYTVINFVEDVDNIFLSRRKFPEYIKEVRTLLHCAEDCAKNGVVWVGTANNPQNIDSAILRAGRTDLKIPIGNMEQFAVADMLKYSLIKHDEKESAENMDYEKVVKNIDEGGIFYTPAELNLFVKNAIKHRENPFEPIVAENIIEEMENYKLHELPTLDKEMQRQFKNDKKYVESLNKPKTNKTSKKS